MILIKNGNIYDGKGNIFKDTDILIEDKYIKEIGKSIEVPEDTKIYDAKDKVVFPGFIDSLNVWGAKGPDSFDCSGFTSYVYRQAQGREIGGWTVPQESAGTTISLSQLAPGDLVFWGSHGATYHVGIYVGGGQYIHAPTSGQTVTVQSISGWSPDFGVRM